MSSYRHVCVLIPLCMCPHTAIYLASSYSYMCVLVPLYMCPMYVSSYTAICALILLYVCPHTAVYVSLYRYICVLILLCMCPMYVSCVCSYFNICVLILQYVPSYCSTFSVLILLHVCPNRRLAISMYRYNAISTYRYSYCYMRPHTAICVSKQATFRGVKTTLTSLLLGGMRKSRGVGYLRLCSHMPLTTPEAVLAYVSDNA